MRILSAALMASLLVLSGCVVAVHRHGKGHHRSWRHHPHRHHSHRHHWHWNAPGPAYAEAAKITELTILSATLPDHIDGEYSSTDEATWRRDWPMRAAHVVADSLAESTDSQLRSSVGTQRPNSGYYMTLEITYLDVGDRTANPDGTPRERGSGMDARGVIINAQSDQVVAEVKFSESMGWSGNVPFEFFLDQAGESLGEWFLSRRKQAGAGSDD